jgi:sugar phosphate isomerase/epimerase
MTRRDAAKVVLGAIPGAVFTTIAAHAETLRGAAGLQAAARPDSTVRGVRLGMNAPYNFGSNNMSADETLARCLKLGISAVELRSQPVEGHLGLPPEMVTAAASRGRGAGRTPDEIARQKAAADALRRWRVAVPMEQARAFRKRYEDAGVAIEIVKFDAMYTRSDDEVDYCFTLAKNLGARAISCEIDVAGAKRIGQFADRHQLMVGYHGHASTGPADWMQVFGFAAHNGANLDIGHFVAGGHGSPVPFLEAHHARVTHIHVKDRKLNDGPNVPFGTGDTPIAEVLRLIRDRNWNIQATIEFEYDVPGGSDRMTEIARCIDYCRQALLT